MEAIGDHGDESMESSKQDEMGGRSKDEGSYLFIEVPRRCHHHLTKTHESHTSQQQSST